MAFSKDAPGPPDKNAIAASGDPDNDSLEDHSAVNERALIRKLDYKLLPALTFLYLLSFLDRSNVGNARVEGLATDLHISGDEHPPGLTLFFIGYVIFEVPCNIVMNLWTSRMWLPSLTLAWGVVSTLMCDVQSRDGLFVARLSLCVTESGLFSGIVFYLSFW